MLLLLPFLLHVGYSWKTRVIHHKEMNREVLSSENIMLISHTCEEVDISLYVSEPLKLLLLESFHWRLQRVTAAAICLTSFIYIEIYDSEMVH